MAFDREWRFTYLNERALATIRRAKGEDVTLEELLGNDVWEVFPEQVGTTFYEELHRALREQKTVEFEAYSTVSNRWLEMHAYPSEDGVSVYFRDTTESKHAEEERERSLEDSQRGAAELDAVIQSIPDAVYIGNESGIHLCNDAALQMLGFESVAELNQNISILSERLQTRFAGTGERIRQEEEPFMRALRGERGVEDVVARHLKTGEDVILKCAFAPIWHEERIVGAVVVSTDITERKWAEKEIETRTQQQAVVAELGLRALAGPDVQSLMDEAVAVVARTLEVQYSEVVDILTGDEELLRAGVGWEDGLVGSATVRSGPESQAGYALLLEGSVIVEDLRTETRFSPSPLLREHGVVSGISVVIHGQEKPLGLLGIYTTSHRTFTEDDVNFLQAVANVLASAVERKEAEEKQHEVREGERSRIARDLHDEALQDLSYALVEAQRVSKDPQPARRLGRLLAALRRVGPQLRGAIYDLSLEGEQDRPFSELLQSLVELQRTMAPQSNISLLTHDGILEGPLGQRGKEVLRIVGEALTNARRHSGAHNIRVSVSTIEDKKLLAEVSDDGRGFDVAEELSASSSTGGMGIRGMRERARALGGDLKIESEPAKGTKVSFELSLEKEREEPEGEEEERIRILLVEDHATVRDALASALEGEAGFEVMGQAESLAQARRILAQEPVDVAVVDLGLPDGYGGDLIKELRETNPQAQALVLSASIDRAQLARAVEHGAAGILNKTVHLDEVVEAVRGLRSGQTLMPLEEVVELLRFAGSQREEEYEARKAIEKLTPREIEVLQALAEGLDSQEIAERLKISIRTERNHMASILAKLEVHSQLQALVFAVRHGVAEIP